MKRMTTMREAVARVAEQPYLLEARRWAALMDETLAAALAAGGVAPQCCRVEQLTAEGELRLVAASPAAAVCIRQILPTLRDFFNSAGVPVRTVALKF